eukprot:403355032
MSYNEQNSNNLNSFLPTQQNQQVSKKQIALQQAILEMQPNQLQINGNLSSDHNIQGQFKSTDEFIKYAKHLGNQVSTPQGQQFINIEQALQKFMPGQRSGSNHGVRKNSVKDTKSMKLRKNSKIQNQNRPNSNNEIHQAFQNFNQETQVNKQHTQNQLVRNQNSLSNLHAISRNIKYQQMSQAVNMQKQIENTLNNNNNTMNLPKSNVGFTSFSSLLNPQQTFQMHQLQVDTKRKVSKSRKGNNQENSKGRQPLDQLTEFLMTQQSQFDRINNSKMTATMNPMNSTLNSLPNTFMMPSTKKLNQQQMNFGGTTKIKLSKDIINMRGDNSDYNTARSIDHQSSALESKRQSDKKKQAKVSYKQTLKQAQANSMPLSMKISTNNSQSNLLQNYHKLTDGLNSKQSVNEKLNSMFNRTTALSQLGISGADKKIANYTKISHNLIVEASDADIDLPSGKKQTKLVRNPSGIIVKDRALSSEFSQIASNANSPNKIHSKFPTSNSPLNEVNRNMSLLNPAQLLKVIEEQKQMMDKIQYEKQTLEQQLNKQRYDPKNNNLQNKLDQKNQLIQNLQKAFNQVKQVGPTNQPRNLTRPLSLRENYHNQHQQFYNEQSLIEQSNNFISENHEVVSVVNSSNQKNMIYQNYLNGFDHVGTISSPSQKQYASVRSPSKDIVTNQFNSDNLPIQDRPFTTTNFNAVEAEQLIKTQMNKNRSLANLRSIMPSLKQNSNHPQLHQTVDLNNLGQGIGDMNGPSSIFEKHFVQFQQEMTERENNAINKELLLMRNKIYTFIRGYDKYTSKLKKKIDKLETENSDLKLWKQKHLSKCKQSKPSHLDKRSVLSNDSSSGNYTAHQQNQQQKQL